MNKLFVPVVVGVSLAGFVGASARELTLEERVAAQTAIEQVYWRHQVFRSLSPCEIVGSASSGSPTLPDAIVPAPGAVFYYVVRAASAHVGSWGASSAGVERSLSCP